ncbi:flagellar protein export ATPase FliI [Papillibacter cinnamivorans]|uniref:Flagellum-specific ATP synthase n=1 Tax=Papillibacter cinnamivorans DSM 12816 TaxID=1122930 RepID=A0A1W1YHM9_9FIRM|nr:flagellar protein export ATPase FliI [Papillibacter cinnamivorans]SMC35644.1 flagellum-specific ATP synthase [Papillibacter cinnamivorans DSM 12816]
MSEISLEKYRNVLRSLDPLEYGGKVAKIVGLTVESNGPTVKIGDICRVYSHRGDTFTDAEVVGFKDRRVLLMSFGKLDGIGLGSRVISTNRPFEVPVGEQYIGRVLDALGRPIDEKGPVCPSRYYSVEREPPKPLSRSRIHEVLPLGVKAIDGLLTVGRGQRLGIFAGSGVGKSTLLGMIARNTVADINVITLVGERGREVKDFIEKDLGEAGLKRSILVVATSDQPAMLRLKSAMVGTAIAEYFRDCGYNVLLLMDSLTRFAMAQREIGMAVGEPPISRGFPPSVYSLLPKLLERSGTSDKGSITGLYTVLVEGDDMNEPIADTVRGILDGHIVLSRSLASANHYPAIDILSSVSRVMRDIVSPEHYKNAGFLKNNLAVYKDAKDLIHIGAYKKGSDPEIDKAVTLNGPINRFLQQSVEEECTFDGILEGLSELVR